MSIIVERKPGEVADARGEIVMLANSLPDWLIPWLPAGWTFTELVLVAVGLFVSTMLVSLFSVGIVIVRLPADYLMPTYDVEAHRPNNPVLRVLVNVLRNLFGLFLVLLGIVLSLPGVPGQGLLTIFIGILVMDFPGKRRMERWLITREAILKAANALRARYGRPPIQVPGADEFKRSNNGFDSQFPSDQ